jgi:hypothetical protein
VNEFVRPLEDAMSWDVSVIAAKVPPPPVAEIPDGWKGDILGSADEVRRRITACLSAVDWSDPTWGLYHGEGFSFEFNVGSKEPSEGFMIHIRGGGNAVAPLLQLAERWGWYLLDCSQGEWLHHCSEAEAGWQGFQAYRDRVLRRSDPQG